MVTLTINWLQASQSWWCEWCCWTLMIELCCHPCVTVCCCFSWNAVSGWLSARSRFCCFPPAQQSFTTTPISTSFNLSPDVGWVGGEWAGNCCPGASCCWWKRKALQRFMDSIVRPPLRRTAGLHTAQALNAPTSTHWHSPPNYSQNMKWFVRENIAHWLPQPLFACPSVNFRSNIMSYS